MYLQGRVENTKKRKMATHSWLSPFVGRAKKTVRVKRRRVRDNIGERGWMVMVVVVMIFVGSMGWRMSEE